MRQQEKGLISKAYCSAFALALAFFCTTSVLLKKQAPGHHQSLELFIRQASKTHGTKVLGQQKAISKLHHLFCLVWKCWKFRLLSQSLDADRERDVIGLLLRHSPFAGQGQRPRPEQGPTIDREKVGSKQQPDALLSSQSLPQLRRQENYLSIHHLITHSFQSIKMEDLV